jgi:circadian clock protein KaiB
MAPARTPEPRLHLRLYVAGNAPNSVMALANAKSICEEHFAERHTLEVVDLLEQPMRALADAIIVTPTLLLLAPLPTHRVVGNLNDRQQVLLTLRANDG